MQQGYSSSRRGRAVPLYETVANHLRDMMISGELRAGDTLPSESRLASELNVSVGTVRKAIDLLADDGLVMRRQGVGTSVLGAEERRELFTLFTLEDSNGNRQIPEAQVLSIKQEEANKEDIFRLNLNHGDEIFRIKRVRTISSTPVIVEDIVISTKMFPNADKIIATEKHLFKFYEDNYQLTISRVSERIRAVEASEEDRQILKKGGPLLQIDRLAMLLDGRVAEWRMSRCDTDTVSYVNTRT